MVKDYIEGGDGADFIDFGQYYNINYLLGKLVYTVDVKFKIAEGGNGADTIYGSYGSDLILGSDGADRILGDGSEYFSKNDQFSDALTVDRLFNDTIYGGGGNDTIYGNQGDDHLYGGDGDDTIFGGSDRFRDRNSGIYFIYGGAGNNDIFGSGSLTIYAGEGNDKVGYIYLTDSTQPSLIDLGSGDDLLKASIEVSGIKLNIVAGEGADTIQITNYTDAVVTLDLAESLQAPDVIKELGFNTDKGTKPLQPVVVKNFDPSIDKLDIDRFDVYGIYGYDFQAIYYSPYRYKNYIQRISSPSEAFQTQGSGGDAYGKGVFIITGASVPTTDLATVAAFLDQYGNNATYGDKKSHIFAFNVAGQGLAVYRFTDDTGANNTIVADELTPLVLLAGVTAEQLNTTSQSFFMI